MTSIPTQVTFHGLPHSAALEADVLERVAWLERFDPSITRCRVVIEMPHRRRQSGRQVRVRVELTVPGGAPIAVSDEPSLHAGLKQLEEERPRKESDVNRTNRDAHAAVHEAFDVARRRLEDFVRVQRGDVKTHS
jgi:hypothetical protein